MAQDMTSPQQLADSVAVSEGWAMMSRGHWVRGSETLTASHPFPVGDLTALVAAWPKDRVLTIESYPADNGGCKWAAHHPSIPAVNAVDTEWAARARLHVAVKAAERAADEPD